MINDVDSQVATAGEVWHALSSAGPLTLAQLKKKVNGSGELLIGLGWLAREDKAEIIQDKKSLRVRLK